MRRLSDNALHTRNNLKRTRDIIMRISPRVYNSNKVRSLGKSRRCSRTTASATERWLQVQVNKLLSIFRHRDHERNMIHHTGICICPCSGLHLIPYISVFCGCQSYALGHTINLKQETWKPLLDSKASCPFILALFVNSGTYLRRRRTIYWILSKYRRLTRSFKYLSLKNYLEHNMLNDINWYPSHKFKVEVAIPQELRCPRRTHTRPNGIEFDSTLPRLQFEKITQRSLT